MFRNIGETKPSHSSDNEEEWIDHYETDERVYRRQNYYSQGSSSHQVTRTNDGNKTNKFRKKTIIDARMVSDYLIHYNPNKISEFKTILLNHDDFLPAWLCESIIRKLTDHLIRDKQLRNELLPIVNFAFNKIDEVIKNSSEASDMCVINHLPFLFEKATKWIDRENKESFNFGLSVDTCQILINKFENSVKLSGGQVASFFSGISILVKDGYITKEIRFNKLDYLLSYLQGARSIYTAFFSFNEFIQAKVFCNKIKAKTIKSMLLSMFDSPQAKIQHNLEVSVATFAKLLAGGFILPDNTIFDDYVKALTCYYSKNVTILTYIIDKIFFIFKFFAINKFIINQLDSSFINKILHIALRSDKLLGKNIFNIISAIVSLVEKKFLAPFENEDVDQLFLRFIPHPGLCYFTLNTLNNYFRINTIKGMARISDQVVKNLIDHFASMPSIELENVYYAIFFIKRSGEEGLLTEEVTNHCLKILITLLSKFPSVTVYHIYFISYCLRTIDQLATINLDIDDIIEQFISNLLVLSESKYATHAALAFFYITRLEKNNFINIKNSSLKNLISCILHSPNIRIQAIRHLFNGIKILSEIGEDDKTNELRQVFLEGITYLKENNVDNAYRVSFLTSIISILSLDINKMTSSENKSTDIDIIMSDDEDKIFPQPELMIFDEANYYGSYYSSSDSEEWEDFVENLYSPGFSDENFQLEPARIELNLSAKNNAKNSSFRENIFGNYDHKIEDTEGCYQVFDQDIEEVGNTCPFAAITNLEIEQKQPYFGELSTASAKEVNPTLSISSGSTFFSSKSITDSQSQSHKRKRPENEPIFFPPNKKSKLGKDTNLSALLARLSFTRKINSLDLDIPTLSKQERGLLNKLYIRHKKVNGRYRLTVEGFELFNESYQRMKRKLSAEKPLEDETKSYLTSKQ